MQSGQNLNGKPDTAYHNYLRTAFNLLMVFFHSLVQSIQTLDKKQELVWAARPLSSSHFCFMIKGEG